MVLFLRRWFGPATAWQREELSVEELLNIFFKGEKLFLKLYSQLEHGIMTSIPPCNGN